MSHLNGLIYIDTTTTPHTGVSVSDINQVLRRGTGDIGLLCSDQEWHNIGTRENPNWVLQRAYKINKFAKYKPIKRSGLDFSSQLTANMTWKKSTDTGGPATWWKGVNGQCGLTFDTYGSLGTQTIATQGFFFDLLKTTPSWQLAWGYEPPTGGINQYPFRVYDFIQYYHYAPKPVEGVYDNLRLYGGGKLTVQIDENRGDDYTVQLTDLTIGNSAVSGWYVGILIYKSSNNGDWAYAFSENTIGSGSLDVEFTGMTNFGGQNVTIVPFLSSVRWAQGGTETTGTFLSCDVEPQTVLIGAEVQDITTTIDARWKFAHGLVHYEVNIINNKTTAQSVSNLRISLYDGYQENDYDTQSSFTVQARSNQSFIGTLEPTSYDPSKRYQVVLSTNPSVTGIDGVNADVEEGRT